MNKIVFDVETKNTFQEVGKNDPAALDISILVTYDYATGSYTRFTQEDFPKLWKLLENCDILIGYNSDYFDIPLLNKYYPGDLTKIRSLDILSEIKKSLGRRISLDSVAEGTLGKKKSGHGLEAVTWWKSGEIEKIMHYCEEDVRITKEVYEYALKNKSLKYKWFHENAEFPVDTSLWEETNSHSINQTLPL